MKIITTILLLINVCFINAQLVTDSLIHPVDLAQYTLAGYGVNVSNVTYSGDLRAFGSFDGTNTTLPFEHGIIMTTGTVSNNADGPHGPNDLENAGLDNALGGYEPLEQLTNIETYNAAVLAFDVVSLHDTIQLDYIFGSEEYPEFVGAQFTDVLAIYIAGPGFGNDTVNLALTPTSNEVINISNINSTSNSALYIQNGTGSTAPYNENPEYIQFDGYTTPLRAKAPVQPGETYHMIIAIADAGDGIYDSGVFIKAQSLTTSVPENHIQEKASISPNPNNGKFEIDNLDASEIQELKVFSSSGKEIQFNQNSTINSQVTIQINNESPGVYWVKIISQNGQLYSSKLVVK